MRLFAAAILGLYLAWLPPVSAQPVITPVRPVDGGTVMRQTQEMFAVQSSPAATCSLDIAQGSYILHLKPKVADAQGIVEWQVRFAGPGSRTATATCSAGGETATATWKFTVL